MYFMFHSAFVHTKIVGPCVEYVSKVEGQILAFASVPELGMAITHILDPYASKILNKINRALNRAFKMYMLQVSLI